MSFTVVPTCDFCKDDAMDIAARTKTDVLKRMREAGWKRVRGKDMCEACVAATGADKERVK